MPLGGAGPNSLLTCRPFAPPSYAGETTTTVTPQVPGGVSDGRWHSVQVQYYNKVGRRLEVPRTALATFLAQGIYTVWFKSMLWGSH